MRVLVIGASRGIGKHTLSTWRNGLISRKNVAALLAQQVADPSFVGRDVVLVG